MHGDVASGVVNRRVGISDLVCESPSEASRSLFAAVLQKPVEVSVIEALLQSVLLSSQTDETVI